MIESTRDPGPARGTPYKQRDTDGSLRFKRVRFKTYEMMRVRAH